MTDAFLLPWPRNILGLFPVVRLRCRPKPFVRLQIPPPPVGSSRRQGRVRFRPAHIVLSTQ